MEINLKSLGQQAVESTTGGKKMRLSENASSMVFQLFTKNVYSNPIGTVVREITSNCFDSHVEAKVNSPVVIKKFFDEQSKSHFISFIDYGVGMSPDRVENIYGVYFESTKRVDNTQIGGFGIGGKTPLAYKRSTGNGDTEYDNSFYVITNFDGTRYYYCIYEGAESPIISLLHSEPTTDRNGTEIRIPVLERDLSSFTKEMVRQLYYFENIIFEGFNEDFRYGETLSNQYQIIRGKSFLFRGTAYSDYMHVCLGRVAYPIDYNVLGFNQGEFRLPIAVRLEVGEANVTVSRENLDYSESTIKMLRKKMVEAKAEILALLAKQYQDVITLEDYFKVKKNFGNLKFSNGTVINVGNLITANDVKYPNFSYANVQIPTDKKLWRLFFESKTYGKKPSRSRYSSDDYVFEGGYDEILNGMGRGLYHYDTEEFNRKIVKQAYLKYLHKTFHVISLRPIAIESIKEEICDLFHVDMQKVFEADGNLVPFMQTVVRMQEEFWSMVQKYTKNYDDIDVPEDFKASRKRGAMSKELRNTSIPVKFIGGSKCRVRLDKLFDFTGTIYFGNQYDESKMGNAKYLYQQLFTKGRLITYYDDYYHTFERSYCSTKDKGGVMFVIVAENNLKYFEFCRNAHKVDHFFSTMLKRKESFVNSYFQSYKLIERYKSIRELFKHKGFGNVDMKWKTKMDVLKTAMSSIPEDVRKADISYAKENLKEYFKIDNVQLTPEMKTIEKMLNDFDRLETANQNLWQFVSIPYHLDSVDKEYWNVLKKVMVL